MDASRQKRKEDISQSLEFIGSPLPYPDPEGFQEFLTQLVCNLLDEGNTFCREREWEQAVREFSEGLNVSNYAASVDVNVSEVLLESLYVNRAAAYHSMGEYDEGVKDCDSALEVCKESHRALYRKALCLKELGKYKEAYSCTTDCMLISRLDKCVNELAQELAIHLGLKNRTPYVSAKVPVRLGNGGNSQSGLEPGSFPATPQSSVPSVTPVSSLVPDILDPCEDSELIGDDLDSLLDCFPREPSKVQTKTETAFSVHSKTPTSIHTSPSVLPPPTPQLPPAFFNSPGSTLNSLDLFSGGGHSTTTATLDCLDDLSTCESGGGASVANSELTAGELNTLDGLEGLEDFLATTSSAAAEAKAEPDAGNEYLDLLDDLDALEPVADPNVLRGAVPKLRVKAVDPLDSLDTLDSFPLVGVPALPAVSFGGAGLDSLSHFSSTGARGSCGATAPVKRSPKDNSKKNQRNNQTHAAVANPLSSTHEFLQACTSCFPRRGQGIYTFVHKPDLDHKCKRDILLCKRKVGHPSEWTRVRPMPTRTSFTCPFLLCNEIVNSGDLGLCQYGEDCTFAYNQLEIDVWTVERKGTLDRNLLFETTAVKLDPVISIIRLLQEHKGVFMFLCQECYDSKPRIISRRCKDSHAICANLDTHHNFDANKCLVFMVKSPSVNYSKVRPLRLLCKFDFCHEAIRYGCQRKNSCNYAHSVIELKTWRVQRDTGITAEEIVKVSTKYYEGNEQSPKAQEENKVPYGGGRGGVGKSLNMKMKFACAQCWRDGLIIEPDKALKHCTAKARHAWTKERWLLLLKSSEKKKWVQIRPLPHAKNFPLYYDICTQILRRGKCNYTGKCTFAHSQEEKEMWMYMKKNKLVDMQQMYDLWLSSTTHNRHADEATLNHAVQEEAQKCIAMPTDFAEPMSGFHCPLCGKHSNSERQWQQHISTEKHKDRVFNCDGEDEALTWSYRFPGTCFKLCPKLDAGCPDGVSCDYAHSEEELQEWIERRDFLRQKLAKAREDMLVMPDEFHFGKYNFLL